MDSRTLGFGLGFAAWLMTLGLGVAACGQVSGRGNDSHDGGAQSAAESSLAADASAAGWASWSSRPLPVFSGQYGTLAGDPSVVYRAGVWWMYYTCYAPDIQGADICLARSDDGEFWANVDSGDALSAGRVLRPGAWDGAHETAFALVEGESVWLWFVGYESPSAGFLGSKKVALGLARSANGLDFERAASAAPVFEGLAGSPDERITSPSVVSEPAVGDGAQTPRLRMLYVGWCIDLAACPAAAQGRYTTLLYATSADGEHWTREEGAVLDSSAVDWAPDGLAESHLLIGPDGRYYLFFSALDAVRGSSIGLAVSDTPRGPWAISPAPLVRGGGAAWTNGGVLAPHVVLDGTRVRMWFAGEEKDPQSGAPVAFRVGYAETSWPIAP